LRCCCALKIDQWSSISRKVEFHATPKHGSWINIAEMELVVLRRKLARLPLRFSD